VGSNTAAKCLRPDLIAKLVRIASYTSGTLGRGVDGGHVLLALKDLDHRTGLGVIRGQPDGQGLGIVVRPGQQSTLADIANVIDRRPMRNQVVVEATLRADPPGEHPPMHFGVIEVEVDDTVDVIDSRKNSACRALRGNPSMMKP